jgi:abequosyltransferase
MHIMISDDSPFLSICIATLNRQEYLSETLDRFAAQMSAGIELVIYDGGSQDGTRDYLERMQTQYSWLKVYYASSPGGIDADYDVCVRIAKGQYCWLFSDDDWPLEGALNVVYSACKEGHDLVLIDAQVRDLHMARIVLPHRAAPRPPEQERIEPGKGDEIFCAVANPLSFIGSCVMRRSIWVEKDIRSFYGLYFPHLAALFDTPLQGSAYIVPTPYISIRYGNASWGDKTFVIWMLHWPALIWKLSGVSEKAKAQVVDQQPWRSYTRLFYERAKGAYSETAFEKYIKNQKQHPAARWLRWVISRLPGAAVNWMARSYLKLPGKANAFLAEELRLSRFAPK